MSEILTQVTLHLTRAELLKVAVALSPTAMLSETAKTTIAAVTETLKPEAAPVETEAFRPRRRRGAVEETPAAKGKEETPWEEPAAVVEPVKPEPVKEAPKPVVEPVKVDPVAAFRDKITAISNRLNDADIDAFTLIAQKTHREVGSTKVSTLSEQQLDPFIRTLKRNMIAADFPIPAELE